METTSFSLPDMILSIKSEVNTIIENEMRLEGLQNIDLKPEIKVRPHPTPEPDNRNIPMRFKIQPPPDAPPPLPMENITDDELVGMTLQAIEQSFKQKWTKLTDIQRKDRIKNYASKYVSDNKLSSENITKIYEALRLKMLVEKSIKPKDFVYDEGTGIIHDIPCMEFDGNTVTMSKQPKTSSIEEKAEATSEGRQETSVKPAASKKTPKLMKTMARLKR